MSRQIQQHDQEDPPAVEVTKDLVKEGHAGEETGSLGPQDGCLAILADDKAAPVEGRRIFCEPARDALCPTGWQQVRILAVLLLLWLSHAGVPDKTLDDLAGEREAI